MFCTHRWSLGKNAFVKLSLITSGLFLWLHQKTCSKFLKAKWTRKHAYKLCFMASTKLSKISLLYKRTIFRIASETTPSSNGSKAILQRIKNEELKIQLAISADLTCPIRELWSCLTKTTTRPDLSDNISKMIY